MLPFTFAVIVHDHKQKGKNAVFVGEKKRKGERGEEGRGRKGKRGREEKKDWIYS